ncbi:helix-turn-helix domain-containing protein [Streptomyces acidiscabies]|uniref:helix-turn-helix domain-containing protein n=1 Tax=Streptomyces acidiscabies TaxID=42234 RepID=UPI00073E8191|nr:helix-turn-helix transcriptional regulator [Streptomyces acidiscabies]GAQ58676.1 anaerobic benzoate catabolism transcriptional regulator [Streptomyces acidiscabies]
MTGSDPKILGRRVKELRREAGMSQSDLAATMGRSESWVSQVERGVQPVERLSILQALADALNVPLRELRPDAAPAEEVEPDELEGSNDLDGLRVALTGHPALGSLFDQPPAGPIPTLTEFRHQVDEAWTLTHASSYAALSEHLSGLLPSIEAAVRHAPANDRTELHSLRAKAYQAAAASFTRQDQADAAWVAADRALQAAELAGQPLEVVASLFRMSHAFMRQQHMEQAEQAATSAVAVMAPRSEVPTCPPEELSLLGAMNLVLSVINAKEGNRKQTHEHIGRARKIAARLGEDRNDFDTEFGPTNVEIHAVSTAVELGDAGLALEVAQKIDASGLSPERQSRFLLDVARAHAQRRHVGEATAALLEAEVLAPEQIHDHHLARVVIRDLVQLSEPRVSEPLRGLADRSAVS